MREVGYALSEALDYVGIDDVYHGKRVAFMASQLCSMMNYPQEKIDHMINIGMLHDCGVSNTDTHHSLVTELDWDGSQDHCVRGAALLKKVDCYKAYSDVILYHHTHWRDLEALDIDESVKINANIILLVDRVDALRAQGRTPEEIRDTLHMQKGKMFNAKLVDLFALASKPESFWFYLESSNLEQFLREWISLENEREYHYKYIEEIAFMFSSIVDAKSSFTAEHSVKVSQVCIYIAKVLQLPQDKIEILALAALLHDLGKLRVEDSILEKKGPLTEDEKKVMDRHGFDSEMILRKIDGFKEIALLASSHHETLDGKGYPYHKTKDELNIESRILMIGDVFQALVQNRPYRKQLTQAEIMTILYKMDEQGKIDTNILKVIEDNLEELYTIADTKKLF